MRIKFDKNLLSPKFRFLLDDKYERPLTILKGGSSSGKTYSVSQCVPMWLLQGRNIIVARDSYNTIRGSIFADIRKAIYSQGLQKYFTIRLAPLRIDSKVSNGSAIFVGTSDEEKLKSITPNRASAYDTVIMEEMSEIGFSAQQQLRLRMRGRSKFVKRTFGLLNPISRDHVIYKKYYEPLNNPDNTGYIDDNIHLHHSTYKDNPYLDQSEIEVLESMAEVSPVHYQVYALGMWGTMAKTVYRNWETREISFEDIQHLPVYIGVDWGYVHAMSVNFVAYDEANKKIYLFDEIHLVEENDLERLSDLMFKKIEEYDIHTAPVFCDTAEPRNRNFLKSRGHFAKPAYKSVNEGIEFIQRHKIVVDRKKCFHTAAELSSYVWKEVDGVAIDQVVKKNDDHCDAFRYALTAHTKCNTGVLWGDKGSIFGGKRKLGIKLATKKMVQFKE